jgi:hypothetical protein
MDKMPKVRSGNERKRRWQEERESKEGLISDYNPANYIPASINLKSRRVKK